MNIVYRYRYIGSRNWLCFGTLLAAQDGKGSMTLLGWLWEQDGSLQYRLRKVGLAFQRELQLS